MSRVGAQWWACEARSLTQFDKLSANFPAMGQLGMSPLGATLSLPAYA